MEFFPKPFHCYGQRIIINIIPIIVPNFSQQPFSRDGFSLIFHQKLQQLVFCLADRNFFFITKYCRFVFVNRDGAAEEILALHIPCPAQQRTDA